MRYFKMKKIAVFIKKEFLEMAGYRLFFFSPIFAIVINVITWYYISKLLKVDNIAYNFCGGNYFAFVLIGIAAYRHAATAVFVSAINIMKEIERGTLEFNLLTPTKPIAVIVYSSLWNNIYGCLQFCFFLLLGSLVTKFSVGIYNLPLIILIIVLSTFCYIGLFVGLSALALIFKNLEPFKNIINVLCITLGGVYFPISILPLWLQPVCRLVPLTNTLEALRKVLIRGASLYDIWPNLGFLLIFICFTLPASVFLFNYAVKKNRIIGNIAFY